MSRSSNRIKHPLQRLFGEEFNPRLLWMLCKKSSVWLLLVFLFTLGSAYLYLRYTPRLYETAATVMVKSENPAKALNIKGIDLETNDQDQLISQIEVIKSNVILDSVIQELPLEVTYYKSGELLANELYKASPFWVNEIEVKKGGIYNRTVQVLFETKERFTLRFTIGGQEYSYQGTLGEPLQTPYFKGKLQQTRHFRQYQQKGLSNYSFSFRIHNQPYLIRELSTNLHVTPMNRQAGTIRIEYRDDDQNKAADIANTVAREYLEYNEHRKTKSAQLIMDFIDKQLQKEKQGLRQVENKIKNFKVQHQFVDPKNEESNILSRFREIEQSLLNLRFEKSALQWLKRYIQKKKNLVYAAPMLNIESTKSFSDLINRLVELQNKKNELLTSVTRQSPAVKTVNKKIKGIRAALLESIDNALKSVNNKEQRLLKQQQQYQERFQSLPRKESRFAHLSRINEIREKFYLMLLEKRSQFAITKAGFVSNNVILKEASPPSTPIYPNKAFAWGIGLMAGVFINGFFIIARYLLHNKILNLSDIEEHTEVPIVGVIPSHPSSPENLKGVFEQNPQSKVAEAFRSLRANLQFLNAGKGSKTMVVTSTIAGEGKTFIALNTGTALAMTGKKVILLDFDLRRPQLQAIFDNDNQHGVSTLLIGKSTVEEVTANYSFQLPNSPSDQSVTLNYIPAGPLPPNPAELLQSDEVRSLFQTLKQQYDVIIIDTPPLGLVSDSLHLLQEADYPIYVLRAGHSDRQFINQVNRLREENGIQQLSLVFNDVGKGASGYGENYNYTYGYGSYDSISSPSLWGRS